LRRALLFLGVAVALSALPARGTAQLLSPGPLNDAHASLEGLRNCTNCHELGRKGASSERCRSCHTLIDTRIRADRGYHASLTEQSCSDCHKEHLGRDFGLVRLDTATFDHSRTGYRLEGPHGEVKCRECHRADRVRSPDVVAWARKHDVLSSTLLGLEQTCRGCHAADDPHGRQFAGRDCETCHRVGVWEKAERFDHDRASYRLTGRHRQASCDGCHPTVDTGTGAVMRFKGVTVGTCSSCHEDNHRGAMGASCTSCHDTRGWSSLDRNAVASRFDHGRTDFPLRGRHRDVDCASCHARRRRANDPIHIRVVAGTERASFPRPRAGLCSDCHVDAHSGELADRKDEGACESCHSEQGWMPASFGVERHNRETGFRLTGAHVVAFCSSCHEAGAVKNGEPALRFEVTARDCVSCHGKDSPHEGRFGDRPCESCHVTDSFQNATFDHSLVGDMVCSSCHADDDPHAGQFGDTGCESCHRTDGDGFRIPDFDHGRTKFPLEGKHAGVACSSCHVPTPGPDGAGAVLYRPLRTECVACHGSAA
jgi:hypothetical protein